MLLVMRHAKSDWTVGAGDHARPLNDRGRRSAQRMGERLATFGLAPDLVITSTATRASTTTDLAAEAGGWDCEIRRTDDFYHTGVDDVLRILRALDESVTRCLVVGHNPTWGALVGRLTGAAVAMRTATVAVIETPSSWTMLGESPHDFGHHELAGLIQPRWFD